MFLNYGAGLHGHEFSGVLNNHCDNFTSRKTPLIRTSLISNNSLSRRNTINGSPTTINSEPFRQVSEYSPRDVETAVHFQEPTHDFDSDVTSEGEASILNSESVRSQKKKYIGRRKRDPQKSSVFHLAHPAPTLSHTQKLLKIRPRILLQLQLLSENTRPRPFIDVLPSHTFIPRLARKFPRLLRGKGELGSNDVVIVRSEDYDNNTDCISENGDKSEDAFSNRDLIAVICQIPRVKGASQGAAEIVFNDGTTCIATPLPGGLYEIRSKGKAGTEMIARWWIKRYPKRESIKSLEFADVNADLKYAFSIIDPNCKRHPTMATITHKHLQILDSYTTLSSSAGRYPPTIAIRDGLKNLVDVEEIPLPERTTHKIDQRMQTLIQVTGIWVSLRQNWCPCFKYNDALAAACTSTRPKSISRVRSSSLTTVSGHLNPEKNPQKTLDSIQNSKQFTKFESVIRRVSLRGRPISNHLSYTETPVKLERTMSAGTVFVQRNTARRTSICASSIASKAEDYEFIKKPPQKVAAERRSVSTSSRSPTPPSGVATRSSTTTTKQTSKEHRRAHSEFYPHSSFYSDMINMHHVRNNNEAERAFNYPSDHRPRISRWKLVTNFFRRLSSLGLGPEHIKKNTDAYY